MKIPLVKYRRYFFVKGCKLIIFMGYGSFRMIKSSSNKKFVLLKFDTHGRLEQLPAYIYDLAVIETRPQSYGHNKLQIEN